MSWAALVHHPVSRSLATLALVAVLGLVLSAIRREVEDRAMEAILAAEAASFSDTQTLRLETTGTPAMQVRTTPIEPAPVLPALHRGCGPKKLRQPPLDI